MLALQTQTPAPIDTEQVRRRIRATSLRETLATTTGIPFWPDNSIRRLRNGDEIFAAMLAAIDGARSFIGFVTFVYWTGDIADRFARALAAAASRGVRVQVVLDRVGARSMDRSLIAMLERAGVELRRFRPLSWRLWRVTHRTHRKLLVVDLELGFTGGVGIAEEWQGDARGPDEWRDSHFEVRGPAVRGLWGAFVGTWLECEGCLAELDASPPTAGLPCGDSLIQVVRAPAAIGLNDVAAVYWTALAAATRSIRIATAYFTPGSRTRELLLRQVRAGVRVEILLPGPHHDARVVRLMSEPDIETLLEAGVRIYRFMPTMMHVKTIIIDDTLACVGSANLNQRSLRKDDEVVLSTTDHELVDTLVADFKRDLERSNPVHHLSLARRGLGRRLLSWLLRPLRNEV